MARLNETERLKRFSKRLSAVVNDRMMATGHGLAETLRFNQSAASNYLNGKKFPPADALRRIADVYGVSMDWLMVRDEGQESDYPKDGLYQKKFTNPKAVYSDPDEDEKHWERFRSRLKQCMTEHGYSYVDVSNMVNMDNQTISAYVRGRRNPKVSTVMKLAHAMGVSYMWLMGLDE